MATQGPVHDRLKSAIEVEQPVNSVTARVRQSLATTSRQGRTASPKPAGHRPGSGPAPLTTSALSAALQAGPGHHSVPHHSAPSRGEQTERSRGEQTERSRGERTERTLRKARTLHANDGNLEPERSRSEDSKAMRDLDARLGLHDVGHSLYPKTVEVDPGHFQNFIGIPIDQLIHKTPIFKECSYDFIETVLMHMKKGLFRPGNYIVEEGHSNPEMMFFLLWGTAAVYCMGEKCRTISEGEAFGEAVLMGIMESWQSTVCAESPCMVCELSRQSLEETLMEFPEEKEYFSKILEKHSRIREDCEETWQVLKNVACFQRVSDDFLQDLENHMDRRIFFPNEEIVQDGEQEGNLYLLELGSADVELSGRLVCQKEVPQVRTKLVYGEEILPQMSNTNKAAKLRKYSSNDSAGSSSEPGDLAKFRLAPQKEDANDDDDWENRENDSVNEAVVFGEECLLGISSRTSKSVRAQSTCDVRILYKSTFLRLLDKYPMDHRLLAPFLNSKQAEVFPELSVRDHVPFIGSGCSQAFFTFLSSHIEERIVAAGRNILLDNWHKYVHHRVPDGNISICRLNRGRVQIIKAPKPRKNSKSNSITIEDHDELKEPVNEQVDEPPAIIEDLNEHVEEEELGDGEFLYGDVFWQQKRVLALEICFLSILHRGVVARAMETLPLDREALIPVLAHHTNAKSSKPRSAPKQPSKVAKILRERSIFANTSQEFINEIIECGTTRVFVPGDRIIEQGTDGTSMFILWLGTSHVVTEQLDNDDGSPVRTLTNVGILPYGSVFGELVMLGVHQRRTASIIAATVCCTWEVQHKHCLAILDRHPIERANFLKLVEEHLDRLAAPRIIYHPLFAGFHQQFRTLIGVNCERKLSFPGETVVREGTHGDKLYIMNLGTASLEISHQHVMQVTGGCHFGFSVMTGALDKYPATVVAETMCQVLIVSNSTYRHALQKYPEMSEMAKALEADEKTKQQRQRAIFARMVRRRRGLRCIIEALRGSGMANNVEENNGDKALLEASFQGWRCCMLRTAELRREEEEQREGNARRIDRWLERRRVQMKKIKPHNDLKRLIDKNLSERGPLKLAKKPLAGLPSARKPKSDSKEEGESPYLSPSPVWRRTAGSLRQSTRRLPPLAVNAGSLNPKGPWGNPSSDTSGRFGAVKSEAPSLGDSLNGPHRPTSSSQGEESSSRGRCKSTEGTPRGTLTELPPLDVSLSSLAAGTGQTEDMSEINGCQKRSPRPPSVDNYDESSGEDIEACPDHRREQRVSVLTDALCFGMGSLPQHVLAVGTSDKFEGAYSSPDQSP